jgi:hypothetical protein
MTAGDFKVDWSASEGLLRSPLVRFVTRGFPHLPGPRASESTGFLGSLRAFGLLLPMLEISNGQLFATLGTFRMGAFLASLQVRCWRRSGHGIAHCKCRPSGVKQTGGALSHSCHNR